MCVHVTLGQRSGQAMRLASRCLWDTTTDKCVAFCVARAAACLSARFARSSCCCCAAVLSFVSEGFENDSLFATAQVYALYFE